VIKCAHPSLPTPDDDGPTPVCSLPLLPPLTPSTTPTNQTIISAHTAHCLMLSLPDVAVWVLSAQKPSSSLSPSNHPFTPQPFLPFPGRDFGHGVCIVYIGLS